MSRAPRPPIGIGRAAALTVLLGVTAGCAGAAGVEATTVLAFGQCHGLTPGLSRVSYARVAAIRGGKLLEMTGPNRGAAGGTGAAPGNVTDGPVSGAGSGAGEDDVLLVAVSRGPQPTPGYSLTLDGAHRRDHTAVVSVHWSVPKPGAVLAQVITQPCLVVALPKSDFQRVEAVDQAGEVIGRLAL